jgi:phosphoenolpyruvate synthase/pyruvate phosphate dikinase
MQNDSSHAETRAVMSVDVPRWLEKTLRDAYSGLGEDVGVAVRSSATAEDLPTASFAGQQETYLNVIGFDAVVESVRRCWASLWTDRAVAYRSTLSLDPRTVKLAVVIQRLVNPRVSGVLFTANPLSGRRHETVIDASFGLGEAIVSGSVNPDHFVVDAGSGGIFERSLGTKTLRVRGRSGGGTETVESGAAAGSPCLSDEQIRSLARRLLGPLASTADFEQIQRGVPHNPTIEMDLALWSISQAIPAGERMLFLEKPPEVAAQLYGKGALPAVVQGAVKAFLATYGHRCALELDGGLPRWAEQPAPVFAVLANLLALVMETGGPMAHGAIVARELGIPAVVAVAEATSRIRTGMVIAVDGTRGRITIL